MEINIEDAGTTVGMTFYVQQILEEVTVAVKLSPGTKVTFTVDEGAVLLVEEDKKVFAR